MLGLGLGCEVYSKVTPKIYRDLRPVSKAN